MKSEELNEVLNSAIKRLDSINIYGGELKNEVERGKAIARLARADIDNKVLVFNVEKYKSEFNKKESDLPEILRR